MTLRRPDQVVEVFAPTAAPHLARIADEIAARVLKEIEALPTDTLRRLLRAGAEIAEPREEFDQFLRRVGVK